MKKKVKYILFIKISSENLILNLRTKDAAIFSLKSLAEFVNEASHLGFNVLSEFMAQIRVRVLHRWYITAKEESKGHHSPNHRSANRASSPDASGESCCGFHGIVSVKAEDFLDGKQGTLTAIPAILFVLECLLFHLF